METNIRNKHTLLITGGAGYVGAMLADQFSEREDISKIICIDKEPYPELLNGKKNIEYIQANLSDDTWQEKAKSFSPDVVIHTAWQIREMYGKQDVQWKWNIEGSNNVFDFAFSNPSVKNLVYFSTVSSYGAFADNELDHFYKESEGFRKSQYLYAEEKRIAEENLKQKFDDAKKQGKTFPKVAIVRPAAITGPRGRYSRIRFGLQSALSGSLKTQKSILYKLISLWVSWVPVTPKWVRQYIHEDDVTDIVALFAFNDLKTDYEAFNISPPGTPVFGKDMADAVGKKMLPISPWMVRLPFFWMWHLTRGRIPTSKGSWKGYSYPIVVDGSKLTQMYGYTYKYPSKEAFVKKEGRYAKYIPGIEQEKDQKEVLSTADDTSL